MLIFLILATLLLGVVGGVLLWLGRRLWRETGLPAGEVVYSDTGTWQRVEEPLISRRHGLVGRPDYLVQVTEKGRAFTIPVEVKSRKRPAAPHEGHILQLAVYCLLVEERFKTPPYGLLRYADATLKIPFTESLRRQVLDVADAIRHSRHAADILRSHEEEQRCRRCGYLLACGSQALNR
ncbi:MAG: CRISPR-associated protein Cas4 [Chloroflexi bacterium]|nr:MAG: CRISPR-associated protein Cas4 [Chloroflexota bacterium]